MIGRGSHVNDVPYVHDAGFIDPQTLTKLRLSQSFSSRQVSFLFGITESKIGLFPEFDVVTLGSEGYSTPPVTPLEEVILENTILILV